MTDKPQVGERVFHLRYGAGRVVDRTGHTHPDYVRVTFDKTGWTQRVPWKPLLKIGEDE